MNGEAVAPTESPTWTMDPRPDIAEDSVLWDWVLQHAYVQDGDDPNGLYRLLNGLRCLGARLSFNKHGLHLGPRYFPHGSWRTREEWLVDRERYLVPRRAAIERLFAALRHIPATAAAHPHGPDAQE